MLMFGQGRVALNDSVDVTPCPRASCLGILSIDDAIQYLPSIRFVLTPGSSLS